MQENTTLHKALHLLTRPLTLLAIGVLLLNDYVLQMYTSSWLTGKLGDFAWLYFAPFALAALLALVFPCNEKLVGWLSFGLVGGVFALANVSQEFNNAVLAVKSIMFGMNYVGVADPTDLITLGTLFLALHKWNNYPQTENRNLKPSEVFFLSIAVFATVATSPAPIVDGILCFEAQDNSIIARNYSQGWKTEDGGISWIPFEVEYNDECLKYEHEITQQTTISHPSDKNITFMFDSFGIYQLNLETNDYDLLYSVSKHSEQQTIMLLNAVNSSSELRPPLDGIIDPISENLLIAMGYEGILVLTPFGEWQNIGIGNYYQRNFNFLDRLYLIRWQFGLGFIFFTWLYLAFTSGKNSISKIVFLISYIAGLYLLIQIIPAGLGFMTVSWLMIIPLCIISIIILGLAIYNQLDEKPFNLKVFNQPLIGVSIFLIPYFAWAFEFMNYFEDSKSLSLFLSGIFIIFSLLYNNSKMRKKTDEHPPTP